MSKERRLVRSFVVGSLLWQAVSSFGYLAAAQVPPPILNPGTAYIHEYDLSPDGRRLTWIADSDDQHRLYVRGLLDSSPVALPVVPGLSAPHWSGDNRHVYVMADRGGDEKYHVLVYDADRPDDPPRDLTPFPGRKAYLVDTNNPDGSALVGLNLVTEAQFGLYRVTPEGGSPSVVDPPAPGRTSWLTTLHGRLFGRMELTRDGRTRVETRLPGSARWTGFDLAGSAWRTGNGVSGASEPLPDGTAWFVIRGALDAATPQRLSLATGKPVESLPSDGVDVDHALFDADGKPLLVQSVPGYPSVRIFDPALRKLLETVPLPVHSFVRESSTDLRMSRLVLTFMAESGEENIVYVDRARNQAATIFHQGPPLLLDQLPKTVPITLSARDGLTLRGYLTLPPRIEPRNLPLVVMVHGGPWVRDIWGFDPLVNVMALQGYAVLRVNYRGSGGLGRAFEDAGAGEWGGKMQDDLTDGTCWAVRQGVADPRRLAIMGGSYGGYAALMALVRTPRLFVGAIEQDGPTDLPSMLGEMPPYTRPFKPIMLAYIGTDPTRQWDRSPLAHVDLIERPVLGVQGLNDPRIHASQLQRLEAAMKKAGKPVTTLYFADEGHGVSHETSYSTFVQAATRFLKERFDDPANRSFADQYCRQP